MHISIVLAEASITRIQDSIVFLFGKSLDKVSELLKKVSLMNFPSVKGLPFEATFTAFGIQKLYFWFYVHD